MSFKFKINFEKNLLIKNFGISKRINLKAFHQFKKLLTFKIHTKINITIN